MGHLQQCDALFAFNALVKRVVFVPVSTREVCLGWRGPHLEDRWLKFLRRLDKAHLHGESDIIYQLNQHQDAVQGPSVEPIAFYSRLTTLSHAAQTSIGHEDFLARLTPSPKAACRLMAAAAPGSRICLASTFATP
jgi:hypothetical protein